MPAFETQSTQISELCYQLKQISTDASLIKLAERRMQLCRDHDVFRWFTPLEFGGFGWSTLEIMKGYLEISSACLSTAFILTQRTGAITRILSSDNGELKAKVLAALSEGEIFATVGISHLTTSHRHLGKPALVARKVDGGYLLNGFSPWVTGVSLADGVVVGASCEESIDSGSEEGEDQILIYASTDLPGVERPAIPELVALTDSCTGQIRFNDTFVEDRWLVGGPMKRIMYQGSGGNTGGLQTSTLALGLSKAAIEYLEEQREKRTGFEEPADQLRLQYEELRDNLFGVVEGSSACTNDEIRTQANSLVLRSTQAALMVAKGSGFVDSHPVGRWCKEALFFLVWSCPQPVAHSNLCELAQIS